ncbi:hypothetical protein ZWY2020_011376 [Hordeum vulgare]|nr:hypothetical protein ZWY2020_011376 [Hordeum vulgare]
MRIRRSASRLLGGAAVAIAIAPTTAPAPSDPLRSEQSPSPPPATTDPAPESSGDLVAPEASSCGEPCCDLNQSPWDLMAELDLSDPEVEEHFEKTYFIGTTRRASWLFPSDIIMPNGSIKEKTTVNMVDEVTHMDTKTLVGKKNERKPKRNKGLKIKKGVWTCKKRDDKKAHNKRPAVEMGNAFYYYDGFGPSRSTKRHCRSSGRSSVLEEPPIKQQKDEACPKTRFGFSAGQADDTDHVVPESIRVEEPRLNGSNADILSCDQESSDNEVLGCYEKQLHDITMRKSPFKKRWRKPVKARSLKSLM